jgi:hypothetical protein
MQVENVAGMRLLKIAGPWGSEKDVTLEGFNCYYAICIIRHVEAGFDKKMSCTPFIVQSMYSRNDPSGGTCRESHPARISPPYRVEHTWLQN